VEADNVIEAISQEPNVSWLENSGVSINRWNCIDVDEKGETYETDKSGVYSAGDVVTGPKTVIEAIATARKAAEAIDKSLTE
jgi:NADPH-dependent glutamate synthase beta subunit-like oxidoreductase